jgi:PAS domain S-box-containing protein
MSVDENVFFREATLRICSSLNIVEALKSCFDYIKLYIPMNRMYLHIYDADLNLTRIVASARDDMIEEPERILSLPEKGRNERAVELNADLLKDEDVIRVWNQPNPEAGIPEILERLGLNAKTSLMNMLLKLVKGKQIGSLIVFADGLNQYTAEHARLLNLLHRPFAIAISNAIELRSHLLFFQNMDRINRAMQGTNDLGQKMGDVLDVMLSVFDCDRAWLLYPCDPDTPSFEAVIERTRPEHQPLGVIPMNPDSVGCFKAIGSSSGVVTFGPEGDYPLACEVPERFGHKSQIAIVLYPKTGKPWALGMHQCSYPRVWTPDEKKLMEEIALRMTDVLTSLLAHRELHESEQRQRAILQTAMDGFFRADMQGRILEVNKTYCRMSGYSEQELLTMNIADVEAVHTAEMIAANIRKFAEKGPNRFESVHRRKDGSLFDVEISAQYQPIAAGQNVVFVRDITERKRAEEALRRSEAYLAEAQRLSHTGSWAFDLASGKFVYASAECIRMYEHDAQEGLPTREATFRLIHPEDRDSVQGGFEKSLREKVDTSSEFRLVLPSGTIKHVQTIRHPVLNEAGDVVELVGTTIDITERKRAEAEINGLKNYLSNIIDSMPSILVGMDNARTVTQWNRQAETFAGILAREAIGKPIADLLPDFAPWIMSMGTDLDKHSPSSLEKLLIEKEGERRFYDLILYPLLVNHVEGSVLRIEDVTERARIQELIVQTEKMISIGGLAAGMAHEINNPLGIITQAAHNIERRISLELHANRKVSEELGLNLEGIRAYFDKRQISDAIASIRTASSRAAKIVANMLQFSRRAGTAMEFTSLAQIIDQALELAASDYDLKKKYDFRSIEIIKDYQDTPQVPIVSVEIEQVILNLLKNAAQAMIANPSDRRPRISFRLRCEDRYVVLELEDNGPGMTEDIRLRVFEPFFTTKEPRVGTGLGLSVSYMIVTQNHKGLMEVQSTPGRGTVFKVSLPIGGSKHEPVSKSIDCGR